MPFSAALARCLLSSNALDADCLQKSFETVCFKYTQKVAPYECEVFNRTRRVSPKVYFLLEKPPSSRASLGWIEWNSLSRRPAEPN